MNINGEQLEVLLIKGIKGSPALAPIVFLHEGLGSVSMWTQRGLDWPLAVCQATGRSGVVYSRRGYGRSEPAPPGRHVLQPDYLHREASEVLPALIAALNIDRPVLLGHSDGASIALLYASRLQVAACIAMAPHVVVEGVAINAIAQSLQAFKTGDLRARLARHHEDVDGAFWQWNDVWLSEGFATFDMRMDCSRISSSLLLIQGADDEYGTMSQLDHIAKAAPHAQQIRLPQCGHSPHRDQPERTLQAVAAFLSSVQ